MKDASDANASTHFWIDVIALAGTCFFVTSNSSSWMRPPAGTRLHGDPRRRFDTRCEVCTGEYEKTT